MGGDLFRKYVGSSIVMCCRLVTKHPFVVGMFIVLFWLYRLFPLLFSVLVSISPVVVSTFVLLGTLLSFGQPNVPEIEKEKRNDRYESRVSESKVLSDSEIVGRDASFGYEEESNVSKNEVVVEKPFEAKTSIVDDEFDHSCVEGDRDVSLVDDVLVQKERLLDEEKKVVLGSRYSPLKQSEDEHEHEHEHIVLESDDKLWEGSPDPLNTNSGLLWKRVEGDDDEEDDDDDEGSDSGSDLAESSSPDASMADIIPMLDELHPLLSEEHEAREVPLMSRDGIDAVSDPSLESSDTSSESNDDEDDDDDDGGGIENIEGMDVRNDEDDKDKESKQIDKEDEMRSAILWTEYDQKNLMNLGTSEMERNRRLENLIARRRARKTMRMQAEKNLIDFESADLPWNIPPISTARINPFDYDSNDNIPGSAPSILLKRRNPFDLPYDSSEEKPDLVGDTFQQEFAVQPKEPFFRRHESFNVGPSVFGASRNERQETKLRPYFVPERSFADFQRQFSGLSDSKVSSVPDTESLSSVGDLENRDNIEDDLPLEAEPEPVSEKDHEHVSDDVSHIRPYFVPEHVASDQAGFSPFQRQISEVSDSKGSSVPDTDSVSSASDHENKDLNEDDHSLEAELGSVVDRELTTEIREHVSEHGNQESESVEDDGDVESVQVPKADEGLDESEIIVRGVTNEQERASDFLGIENVARIQLNMGDEGSHSSESSLSSSDEASEQIYNEKEDDVAESVSETTYFVDRVNSMERSDIDVTSSSLEESHPNEPIYDLSPRSVTRNLSSSSILNDLHKDESFQHNEDQKQASSPVADVKLNSIDSSPETSDAQNQLLTVDNEDPMLAGDNVSTTLPSKPLLETEDVLDMDASQQLEQVQVLSSNSHARSHEEVISQVDEESLFGGSVDKPLAEDPEALQGCELEQGQVASSNSESVHGEASEIPHQYVSGKEVLSHQQKEFLLDTSVDKPLEENPQVLQVQITSSSSGNLEIQELENSVSSNINFVPSAEPDVVEVADIKTKEPGSPVYASDTFSIENNVPDDFADVDEVKEIDEDLLVELDAVGDFSVMNLGSTSNEMKEDPHVLEHDLETMPHVLEQDLETMPVADEESYSEDMESILDEMKQDSHASEHDIETHNFADEDSSFEDLRSTLDGMKQDPQASDHDLETKNSEGEDSYSKDFGLTFNEKKQEPHASDLDLETKNSGDKSSYPKDFELPLDEMKQDPHSSEHSIDGDSDSKDLGSTLDEMQQEPQAADHDLETEPSRDEGTDSKDLGSTLEEMQQGPWSADHDLETEPFRNEGTDSKDIGSTLDEMQQEPLAANHDLETEPSRDKGTLSMNLGSPLDEIDPHASKHDLETNRSVDEDSYSKDLESTFNEIRRVPQASEHRLDTFYSVDENFYSKHVESTLNEMKDPQALEHDIETKHSDNVTDADVMKAQNEKESSNMEGAGASEAEASKSINNANGLALPQETDLSASLANSTSANHEMENASSTSNTDKA